METLTEQIAVMVTRDDLRRIEDMRFERRYASRGALVRTIIKKGLEVMEAENAAT